MDNITLFIASLGCTASLGYIYVYQSLGGTFPLSPLIKKICFCLNSILSHYIFLSQTTSQLLVIHLSLMAFLGWTPSRRTYWRSLLLTCVVTFRPCSDTGWGWKPLIVSLPHFLFSNVKGQLKNVSLKEIATKGGKKPISPTGWNPCFQENLPRGSTVCWGMS